MYAIDPKQIPLFSAADDDMHDYSFYSAILGLSSVWRISDVTIDEQSGDIELHIRSHNDSMFSCSTCGAIKLPSRVSKTRWLHENHLNIRFYISALIPIIDCECCGEMKVEVPWKKAGVVCEEDHDARQRGDNTAPLPPVLNTPD